MRLILTIVCSLFIAGCNDTSCESNRVETESCTDDTGTTDTTPPVTPVTPVTPLAGNVSYVPLTVFEKYDDFSSLGQDDIFQGEQGGPYIPYYMINPIDDLTLVDVNTAVVGDFTTSVNDYPIDEYESHPKLQKVIGNPVTLRTALLFDVSGSTDAIDFAKLVTEAKVYIDTAQASSDTTISTQEFTVWAFGTLNEELTTGFTSTTGVIKAALDNVTVRKLAPATLGVSSNLNGAILETMGRYKDVIYDFSFAGDGRDNDLVDSVKSTGINLSQLVVFSNGEDTYQEFDATFVNKAVESQSLIKYNATNGEKINAYKPVFYYVLGSSIETGVPSTSLSENAEITTSLNETAGKYTFADNLVNKQISAIEQRVNRSNQYLYRYAFLPRIGDHKSVFKSRGTGFNYSLTTDWKDLADAAVGTPTQELASLVEITGENGEFISNNTISITENSIFQPVTRWTNNMYDNATDYAWLQIAGAGSGVANVDGSYTVTAAPVTLQLTNVLGGHIATGHSATVVITN